MMEQVAQVLFLVGLVAWLGWVIARRYWDSDLKDKEMRDLPTDQQVQRHVRYMRQDLSMLAVTNFAILLVLVYALVLKV
ncbi:MAG: hypothetical protein HYU76_08260 [Betaproteobacteria bacterium]|nr:hypothetical protein [Betaproteobacteria bacterium]